MSRSACSQSKRAAARSRTVAIARLGERLEVRVRLERGDLAASIAGAARGQLVEIGLLLLDLVRGQDVPGERDDAEGERAERDERARAAAVLRDGGDRSGRLDGAAQVGRKQVDGSHAQEEVGRGRVSGGVWNGAGASRCLSAPRWARFRWGGDPNAPRAPLGEGVEVPVDDLRRRRTARRGRRRPGTGRTGRPPCGRGGASTTIRRRASPSTSATSIAGATARPRNRPITAASLTSPMPIPAG